MNDARATLEEMIGRPPVAIEADIVELSRPTGPAHYDRIGRIYDAALSTRVYNWLLWNSAPARYRAFATSLFESQARGAHVEIGCGSLLFTAHLYTRDRGRPVVLIDESIAMLRLARARLNRLAGGVPRHVVLVRGDGRSLGVAQGIATTALAMLVLHVVNEPDALLQTLARVSRPTASTIGVASLFQAGGRGDMFLALLHAVGELSAPRSLAAIEQLVTTEIPGRRRVETDGSLAFVTVTR
jgi:SAM-dependent methyltransferase